MFSKIRFSIVLKVSILAGSIAAVASLIVGTLIVQGSSEIVYQNALNHLKHEANINAATFVAEIKYLRGDALYLAATPPILGIPRAISNNGVDPMDNSNLSTWQNRLATIFSELIRAKPSYLQIRYIEASKEGKELVRVDRKGNLVYTTPDIQLQQKADSPYFKETIKLHPGEVFLSAININREYGEITEPFVPTIRAAAPVFFQDKLFGILIINMAFNDIVKEFITNTPRDLIPYVTNEDGYFLAHPDSSKTFGFDLNNRNKIQTEYPGFKLEKTGDIRDKEFTVHSAGDVIHIVKARFDPQNTGRFIAVMLATSYENLQSASNQLQHKSFIIMAILVIASLFFAGILASKLLRPLKLISIAADNLANGKDVKELPVGAKDEIGDLARSFKDMHRQLEEKERELIVSQGRVHHANKLASLGEMASGMAHEINSPVQAISLIAQRIQRQIKKEMTSAEIDNSMSKIITSVNKISEIIESLRKVSRDSTDEDFLDTRVSDLIQDSINMTEERFRVNNVQFGINYHGVSENTLVQCQRLQLSQVLINLINNAYDAIRDNNEKWISVDISKKHNNIRIAVIDSGTGIPKNIMERIFEPMFTTKEIGEGTGLGLSISREIVSAHNGQLYIDVKSPNTRFVIDIPLLHNSQSPNIN